MLNDGPPAGPHNAECEIALLGAVLHNNEVYTSVADFLAPEHFWEPLHAEIYQTACELIELGKLVNSITIQHHFHDHEGMRALGGANVYFARLAASCPAIVTAPDYARVMVELAGRRRVIDIAEQMRTSASSSEVRPADDILSEGIDLISNGSGLRGRIRRTRASFGDKASTVIEDVNQAYMDGGATLSSRVVTTGSAALDQKRHAAGVWC